MNKTKKKIMKMTQINNTSINNKYINTNGT